MSSERVSRFNEDKRKDDFLFFLLLLSNETTFGRLLDTGGALDGVFILGFIWSRIGVVIKLLEVVATFKSSSAFRLPSTLFSLFSFILLELVEATELAVNWRAWSNLLLRSRS